MADRVEQTGLEYEELVSRLREFGAVPEGAGEVAGFLDAPAEIVNSRMVGFYDAEPYVDANYGDSWEFLLSLGQIWPMFRSSGGSFDAIAEACSYLVTDGLVFDWTDAEWASPPPPPEYNRSAFWHALTKKFEYVTVYSDWLVIAIGKLEPESGDDEP